MQRLLILAVLLLLAPFAGAAKPDLTLWYNQPAAKWEEALPVGSGRLGAMVFGGVADERIQFNEDTLWTGKPHDYVREGAGDHLKEIQQLVFDGREKEAVAAARPAFLSDPVRQKAYQPFGDIRLTFPDSQKPSDYRRQLDLNSAIASVSYKSGSVTYKRETFASYPDNVIAVRITADQPGKVSFNVGLTSPHRTATTKPSSNNTLVMTGQVLDPTAKDEPGMKFESRVRVLNTGGQIAMKENVIEVKNADAVTLLLVAATDFVNFQDISADPAKRCEEYLAKLDGKDFDALKVAHVADYQKLFRRVTLSFDGPDKSDVPTDQRLKAIRNAANPSGSTAKNATAPSSLPPGGLDADPNFAALFFQYGRYLLISSSRPHTQPANLQGVWNELINPPWESKYTTNINLEMNYWPAEPLNLSECASPLWDMIDDLRISGARTAEKQYHAHGWVLHHNTDHWRGTAPINNIDGIWPTGGAWLCYHLWEHYLFTGDKKFLAERAYPAMKEASQFFLDTLVKDPKTGWLCTNPSFSPEQGGLCAGPAMDMQLIRALFDATTESAKLLNLDSDLVTKIADTRKQLVPDQVDKNGFLMEWKDEVDKFEHGHRHMSPLFGLFPGAQFIPDMDPKIWSGVLALLKDRGDGSTGWSYAWRIPLWARVHDGEMAYREFALQLGKKTLSNCFDLCGPYQIDGNFGGPAGVGEMLLQSHIRPTDDRDLFLIDVLPALPKVWPKGSVTGLRARGGFNVDLAWADGKLKQVTLKSLLGRPVKLRYRDKTIDIKTEPNQTYTFDVQLEPVKKAAIEAPKMENPPIVIEGPEQSLIQPNLSDFGLPPAVGVQSVQIFRATKTVPELADQKGYTYHHHVDMAAWKGRLYVGWNSCEKDEDTWPSHELYSSSTDGVSWTQPAEMFPQGVSTPLRMYFFRGDPIGSSGDRMLMIAGLRTSVEDTSEEEKGGLVVRELRADHTLGDIYVLQAAKGKPAEHLAMFTDSKDTGFVAACKQLLADNVFLEQQDLGKLLGDRKMTWHDPANWPGGKLPGDDDKWVAGKAYSFFTRKDGLLVGISKMGFTTSSTDNGKNWSMPGVPPTLVTGKAKVWSQQTSDGRYALVYNPSTKTRFPLVVVTSDDGQHFRDMRIVQGELPIQRYEGKFRSVGPQYIRGISKWSDDGSRKDDHAMWLVYSMSKEDIWVSRVPLPVKPDETADQISGFDNWNTYRPKWTNIALSGDVLRLVDKDPYDYARATRVFREGKHVIASFEAQSDPKRHDTLEVEILPKFGGARPVRVLIPPTGTWTPIKIEAECHQKHIKFTFGDKTQEMDFAEPADSLERISFRTGPYRNLGGPKPVAPGTDKPTEPASFELRKFSLTSS